MSRPDWDTYFMNIAHVVATRATCNRKLVGAVIVRDRRILSTGYNGAPAGLPECDVHGHELVNMHGRDSCVRTAHAEANAIAQAAKNGIAIDGATIYTTASPCYECMKLIINSGARRVVFGEAYSGRGGWGERAVELLKATGIDVVNLSVPQSSNQ